MWRYGTGCDTETKMPERVTTDTSSSPIPTQPPQARQPIENTTAVTLPQACPRRRPDDRHCRSDHDVLPGYQQHGLGGEYIRWIKVNPDCQ